MILHKIDDLNKIDNKVLVIEDENMVFYTIHAPTNPLVWPLQILIDTHSLWTMQYDSSRVRYGKRASVFFTSFTWYLTISFRL